MLSCPQLDTPTCGDQSWARRTFECRMGFDARQLLWADPKTLPSRTAQSGFRRSLALCSSLNRCVNVVVPKLFQDGRPAARHVSGQQLFGLGQQRSRVADFELARALDVQRLDDA